MSTFARLIIAALALHPAGAVFADKLPTARLVLDWAYQGQASPWTLAEDRGWFRAAGADIRVSRGFGSADTVSKVAAGAYEVGYADIYVLLRFADQKPQQELVAFFMVHDKSALAITTLADSSIRKPADLAGRTIAAPVGDASRDAFPLFAAQSGFDPARVKWLSLSADLREAALLRRQADAVSGHVLTVTMNMQAIGVDKSKLRSFSYADHGVPLYGHFLFTTRSFASAHPQVLTAIIRGTVRGMREMIRDPQAGVNSVRKRDSLLDPQIEQERIRLAIDTMFVTARVKQLGYGSIDMERFDTTLQEVARAYGLRRQLRAADIYTGQYLPTTAELRFEP